MTITTIQLGRLSIARESTVIIASGVTIDTTDTLKGLFDVAEGTDVSAIVKSITITPPETAHDLQSFLGVDTNNFQNQEYEEKPPTDATIAMASAQGEDEAFEPYLDSSPTPISSTPTFTRYQIGNSQALSGADFLVEISGATGTLNIALIDAKLTKHGDLALSAADAHWENNIEGKTLAKNFYWEFED